MQALDNKQEEEIEVSSIYISKIEDIRKNSGKSDTPGLSNSEIFTFLSLDASLKEAITQAHDYHSELRESLGNELLMKSEKELVKHLQEGFVNFYAPATINKYVEIVLNTRCINDFLLV